MSSSLPPIIGTQSSQAPKRTAVHAPKAGHAERGAVSMYRAMRKKDVLRPTASISRAIHMRGMSEKEREKEFAMYSEEDREEIRTRLRYRHIRQLMKEKKEAEKEKK